MATFFPDNRSRAVAAAAALALQALIGWALVTGLAGRVTHAVEAEMQVVEVALPPPPPPPKPVAVRRAARRPSGAAAPPHARATPTPVVAPPPVITLPPPPPLIVAAPVAALGSDADSGAATAGPGTGAGGQGTGRGAGDGGNGTGTGGTPARLIRGRITDRDYPLDLQRAGISGNLTTRYTIGTNGRITRCEIVESSGHPELDALTCRLATERFRYAPARDASGRKVEDQEDEDHGWRVAPETPD